MIDKLSHTIASPQIARQEVARQKITSQKITWQKINWQKAGRVTEPGRYMFRFGWLTVTAEDIAVWRRYPDARFTMLQIPKSSIPKASEESAEDATAKLDEYHLGTFELPSETSKS
jgi:hypothetical protein